MTMARFSPRGIFLELRRRRLFNTVALYVVGAWVALQVTELALPGLGIPDFAIRYVWIGAFLLFPLVLFFGWRYDISARGIQVTPAADAADDADSSLHRLDHGIIAVLSSITLVVIGAMGLRISQVEPDPTMTTVENSIAVLPFEVCEDLSRERRLAGGLTMEVINRLAERGKLKVIAHASSYMMAGLALQKHEIAKPLGVQYLLSGKVCRYEGELTLAAELFDQQGFVVWADSYIQKVNQWDQITGRLATLVADGVALELGDVVQSMTEAPVNRLAYEQLLIGVQYREDGNKKHALAAFNRALEYDPEYAEALFYRTLLNTQRFLDDGREESIAQARPAVEQALAIARRQLELNDRSAYAHYMLARLNRVLVAWDEELAFRWNHASGLNEDEITELQEEIKSGYAESERHFRSAIALNPSLTNAYTWLAEVIENQDIVRRAEALETLEDGQVRDPFNLEYNGLIAKRWAGRGRYRQAIELLERFKDLPEIPPMAWWWQLELMQLQGFWDEKAETLVDMLQNDPGAFDEWLNRWQAWWFVGTLAESGLYEEAEAWKERIENMPMYDWSRSYGLGKYLYATGREDELPEDDSVGSLITRGAYDQAIAQLETTRHERKMWHERAPRDDMLLASLYQQLGRHDEASMLLESVVNDLEAEYESGVRHSETLYHLAEAYARQGRDEDALDMWRKSYDYHFLYTCEEMEGEVASPWLRFGKDPLYISLCERIDADLEYRSNRIRATLAELDVDELLAPLMALAPEETGGN
jgi:TolB-like protein